MHSVRRWGQLLAATMLMATPVVMVRARVPLRALTTPCAGPLCDGTLLFTSQVPGAPGVTLFAADPARTRAPQALVRALPGDTVIAPSPRGRSMALAEGTRGLWLINSDGTGLRRLLPAPPPSPGPTGTRYIHAVAWSPDRYTLAYAVVQPLGYPRYPAPPRAQPDGLWLVRYDRGSPRLLASNTQLAVDGIGDLSFSADGRTLAVVASQGRRADNLAVDVATGRATPLLRTVDNVDDVQFSPVSPRLAYRATVYVPVAGQAHTVEADEGVYVADPQGRHRAMLTRTTLSTSIQSLVWSPDGRNVAYLWGGARHQVLDEIRAVDVATRHVRPLVGAAPHRQFTDLAWMHCRA